MAGKTRRSILSSVRWTPGSAMERADEGPETEYELEMEPLPPDSGERTEMTTHIESDDHTLVANSTDSSVGESLRVDGVTAAELEAKGVHAWFGERMVLQDINLVMERRGHGPHRTFRVRQVNLPADPEPDARDRPLSLAGGTGGARRGRYLRPEPAGSHCATPHRHGVPDVRTHSRR